WPHLLPGLNIRTVQRPTVYVGLLKPDVTTKILRKKFSDHGDIQNIWISGSYGYVDYLSIEQCWKAIEAVKAIGGYKVTTRLIGRKPES
ncbi:hypothetical protein LINPERHAP2_LOCUS34881, partial [Linum perenne]